MVNPIWLLAALLVLSENDKKSKPRKKRKSKKRKTTKRKTTKRKSTKRKTKGKRKVSKAQFSKMVRANPNFKKATKDKMIREYRG